MPLFDTEPPDTSAKGRLTFVVQLASLVATGWLIWMAAVAPRLHRRHFPDFIVEASGYVLLAWAWSAAVTLGLYFVIPSIERTDMVRVTVRTSTAAVWFAPATFLLAELSPGAFVAAVLLAVSSTRLLFSQWRSNRPEAFSPPVVASRLAGSFEDCQLRSPLLWRALAPALVASLCVQAGVVAALVHYPVLAGALLVLSTAVLTVFAMTSGAADAAPPRRSPRPAFGVLLTILLAVGLTVGGSPGFRMSFFSWLGTSDSQDGGGILDSARALLRRLFTHEQPAGAREVASRGEYPPSGGVVREDGFPGVVLWPEIRSTTTLVAPLPRATGGAPSPAANPMSIPFSGEYWMYRWPFSRPPQNSFFERASPMSLSFTTTDHRPLEMEAHHKLDTPISLKCCRKIQIAIWNRDRYPRTIALELILLNTELAGAVSESLGKAEVKSIADARSDPPAPVSETLAFAVPAAGVLEEFNEFKVVFHRDRSRIDKSARLSIDRFILVP